MKAANILETIGNTPHIRINRLFGDRAEVWIKQERANPGGSIKDRIALSMVEDAERSRQAQARRHDHRADLRQHRHRPRDGRRGQGLQADPGHARQHERRAAPADARLRRDVRPDAAREGHEGRDRARRGDRRRRRPDSWMPQQFDNPANVEVHRRTTAQEILRDFADKPLDALITGVGTGGHITGCAEVLKKRVAEPQGVRGRADAVAGASRRQAGPAPDPGHRRRLHSERSWTPTLLDGVIQVEADDAKEMARRAAREEGMLVGISSGATLAGDRAEAARARRQSARCSASTTTPASAICRSPDFLPEQA